jgi:lipopolysaccharide/colanic/teichoic acid biosynthesis glycosyltransferase
MPVDQHPHDTTIGSVSGPMFSHADSGGVSSGTVAAHPSSLEAGTARGASHGPSELFTYRVMKRAMDVLLVLAATPVLIPLLLLIAAAVRVSSPGPVFFSHRRIRGHGVFFTMWKFRTMCVNSTEILENYLAANPEARQEWHKSHKLKNDPRVTRVGTILRKTSLDELPQLWNVFTGSMSLVGPRPIVAAEVEKYGDGFASYCMVKPGITGLWQVSGRSSTSYDTRILLDKRYVKEWSFIGDVLILLKTFVSVANQDGAY